MKRQAEPVTAATILTSALLDTTALVDTVSLDEVVKALGKSDAKGKSKAFVARNRGQAHERSSDTRAIVLRGHLVAQRAAIRKQVRANIEAFELPAAKSTDKADESESEDDAPSSSKPVHPAARLKSRPTNLPVVTVDPLKNVDEVIEMLEEEKRALDHEVIELERDIASLRTTLEACVACPPDRFDAHSSFEELSAVDMPSAKSLEKTRAALAAIVGD